MGFAFQGRLAIDMTNEHMGGTLLYSRVFRSWPNGGNIPLMLWQSLNVLVIQNIHLRLMCCTIFEISGSGIDRKDGQITILDSQHEPLSLTRETRA